MLASALVPGSSAPSMWLAVDEQAGADKSRMKQTSKLQSIVQLQALSLPSKCWTNASLSSIELSISSGGNLIVVRLALFSAHEPL